jgi:hypothetical protein
LLAREEHQKKLQYHKKQQQHKKKQPNKKEQRPSAQLPYQLGP